MSDRSVETENKSKVAKKKHVCPYDDCFFAFDRPFKLTQHLNIHTNQRPFKCDTPGCSKAYTNNSHLQRHKSVSHSNKKLTAQKVPCPFPNCSKVFADKWGAKRHFKSHYIIGPYICIKCSESFKKFSEFQIHFYGHWGLDPFVCNICKESFKIKTELKRHERKHKVYCCEEEGCAEEFSSWNVMRTHLKQFHPKQYQCDFCNKFYKNKWTLTEHVMTHLPFDERDVILCPYIDCERYYFYERNLEAHIKSFHQGLQFKCKFDECEKTFTTKKRLKDHEKRHLEPTPVRKFYVSKSRKPRKDKGVPKKSMAAMLSGICLPQKIDKDLAQKKITPEVKEYVESLKGKLNEVIQIESNKPTTS